MSMGAIFLARRNSFPPLFFLRTTMSDVILSDCHLSHTANVIEYWWEGSAPTAVPPPTPPFDILDQHNTLGGITIRAALAVVREETHLIQGVCRRMYLMPLGR